MMMIPRATMTTNSASICYMSDDGLLLLRESENGTMSRYDWKIGEWVEDSLLLARMFSGSLDVTEVSESDIAYAIRRRTSGS